MEYSKDNTMTRKEYLKSKKKKNFLLSKLKYVLLTVIVVLLGVYVFKQLNVYNNVTKIANKVVEETMLAKTMTMYYVSEPYTKDGQKTVMLYRAYDESRTTIPGTEEFTNIQIYDNKLYGISENLLYAIDLTTYSKEKLTDKEVQDYVVIGANIYLVLSDGVYKQDIISRELTKIIDGTVYQLLVDDNNLFVLTEGKTSKSIVKYNLNGKNEKELSEKYIVSNMYLSSNNIYFINSKDSKLYSVSKSGGEIKKVIDKKIPQGNSVVCYKDSIYYINKDDSNTLYTINLKTGVEEQIVKKNLAELQIVGNVIYYSLSSSIGIYKYDIETGKNTQATSVRTSEFICIN